MGGEGGLAKDKRWFGLGRTPCPVQAENISVVCLLQRKEEEREAQASVPGMHSAGRESMRLGSRTVGLGPLIWTRKC